VRDVTATILAMNAMIVWKERDAIVVVAPTQ
jgi:hypothetical protein